MQVDVKTSETNLQGDGTPQVPILGRNSTEIQESRLTKYTENELSAAAPKNRKFEPVVKSKTYKCPTPPSLCLIKMDIIIYDIQALVPLIALRHNVLTCHQNQIKTYFMTLIFIKVKALVNGQY